MSTMMISRRSLLLGAGVPVMCGLLTLAALAYRRTLEPQFEGRTLSQWYWSSCLRVRVSNLNNYPLEPTFEEKVVFRTFGDAAVPFLVRQWRQTGTNAAAIAKIQALSERLPSSLRPGFLVDPRVQSRVAWCLLESSRPSWRAMRPYVEELNRSGNATNWDHQFALSILGWMRDGTEHAVPYLTNALASADRWTRALALAAVAEHGTNVAPAMPSLLVALDDPLLVRKAADVLARLGPTARPALPRLRAVLREARAEDERPRVAAAIISIDVNDTEAADYLRQNLLSMPAKPAAYLIGWIAAWELRPNPTIAALLEVAMARPDLVEHRCIFIGYLPRHDAVAGREKALAAFRVASITEKLRLIGILLWHLNFEEELISWACDQLEESANVPSYDRETCLRALDTLLPGNQRVTRLLENIAAQSPHETHRILARATLRRIQLNGLVRDLDERDAQAAKPGGRRTSD